MSWLAKTLCNLLKMYHFHQNLQFLQIAFRMTCRLVNSKYASDKMVCSQLVSHCHLARQPDYKCLSGYSLIFLFSMFRTIPRMTGIPLDNYEVRYSNIPLFVSIKYLTSVTKRSSLFTIALFFWVAVSDFIFCS